MTTLKLLGVIGVAFIVLILGYAISNPLPPCDVKTMCVAACKVEGKGYFLNYYEPDLHSRNSYYCLCENSRMFDSWYQGQWLEGTMVGGSFPREKYPAHVYSGFAEANNLKCYQL
jgi:hypothetical protein